MELTRPRFLIYTDAYFSWAFEPEEPRPLGDSDAEIAAAARAYDSAAGTYIRDGVNIVPWWQVLLALVVAMMLTGLVTRRIRNWHYVWSMGFSASALGILLWTSFAAWRGGLCAESDRSGPLIPKHVDHAFRGK